MLDLIIAALLILFSLMLIFIIGFSVLRPLSKFIFEIREKTIVDRAAKRLEKVEKLLNEDNFHASLEELRKAFIYNTLSTEQGLKALREHHENALSRCIAAAEQLGGRLENLAYVEKILNERAEILSLLNKALGSYQNLKARREGKKTPSWSKNEYQARIVQIKGELSRNQKLLDEELNKLFMFLKNRSQENIVFH